MGVDVAGDVVSMGLVVIAIPSFSLAAVVCMMWHWSKVYSVGKVSSVSCCSTGVDVTGGVASAAGWQVLGAQ